MTMQRQSPHDDYETRTSPGDTGGMPPMRGMIDARVNAGKDDVLNTGVQTAGMPRGEMNAASGTHTAGSESMPAGAMTSSGNTTAGAGEMPSGLMASSARNEQLGAITLPGLWRLTLTPVSE